VITKELEFYCGKLKELAGGTIKHTIHDGECFFGLRVEKDGQLFNFWLLSDDEGNDHGSFDIEQVSDKVDKTTDVKFKYIVQFDKNSYIFEKGDTPTKYVGFDFFSEEKGYDDSDRMLVKNLAHGQSVKLDNGCQNVVAMKVGKETKADGVKVELEAIDFWQILEGIRCRAEQYRNTQYYWESDGGSYDSELGILECKDEHEAERIADHYYEIIGKMEQQLKEQGA
jgi:hypothetical protein